MAVHPSRNQRTLYGKFIETYVKFTGNCRKVGDSLDREFLTETYKSFVYF